MEQSNRLHEDYITDQIEKYLLSEKTLPWNRVVQRPALHAKGANLILEGGEQNECRFIIECKGCSEKGKRQPSNVEGWLHALGQLVTRMQDPCERNDDGTIEILRKYQYGLGLWWGGAQSALRRIPEYAAVQLNLYVLSVYDDGTVKQWTPQDFGKQHEKCEFAGLGTANFR